MVSRPGGWQAESMRRRRKQILVARDLADSKAQWDVYLNQKAYSMFDTDLLERSLRRSQERVVDRFDVTDLVRDKLSLPKDIGVELVSEPMELKPLRYEPGSWFDEFRNDPQENALCGYQLLWGRTCTRPAGHAIKDGSTPKHSSKRTD